MNASATAGLVVVSPEALRELVREAVAEALGSNPPREVERQIVGPNEMSRRLDVSRTTLHRLRLEGCPAVKLGDVYKYEPAAVLAWLKARGQK